MCLTKKKTKKITVHKHTKLPCRGDKGLQTNINMSVLKSVRYFVLLGFVARYLEQLLSRIDVLHLHYSDRARTCYLAFSNNVILLPLLKVLISVILKNIYTISNSIYSNFQHLEVYFYLLNRQAQITKIFWNKTRNSSGVLGGPSMIKPEMKNWRSRRMGDKAVPLLLN